ncbi:tRNA (guanine-N(7)-)-methyltransferase [Mycoplasma synoviae GX11-T]|nr:tRNA (guanosine(46)-N7)-methyltransferase TrmB [Mycoplasmopsis synoviae]MBD5788571.1 tRNA (guanine-N(7)-)-methyltransferase [Mycoplasmopsis synoviae GX11-T]
MRLRNDKFALSELNKFKFFIKNYPFNIKEDDILEIGSGKGEMISQMALLNPNQRFIAIEKYPTVAKKIMQKIKELNLENLYISCIDASKLSENFIGKTNTIWLTFSDPWPKKRHEKRRLTYKSFLDQYKFLLKDKNSNFYLKTDNDLFFNYSLESLQENNWNLKFVTGDLHNSIYNETNIKTGYEIKWMDKTKINFLIASKGQNA